MWASVGLWTHMATCRYDGTTEGEGDSMRDDAADHEREVTAPIGTRPPSRLRQILTVSWVITIVLFTIARVVVAKETLEVYGLNIWVFAFIDLITAVPYAIGVARVITSMIDRDFSASTRWALVAFVSFIAPYVYVAWAGRDASFPPAVWIALAVLVLVFGTNAIVNVRRKVAQGRTPADPEPIFSA